MPFPDLNNQTFYASRQKLTVLAQARALDVVRRVQIEGLRIAIRAGMSDAACRLMKADVTESVLAKDVLRVAALPDYATLDTPEEREQALEAGLTGALLTWVASRLSRTEADQLYGAFLDYLIQDGPGDA